MAEESNTIGILDRLLAFMDQPWKAVVIIFLVIIGGAGYILYLERAEIAQAILSHNVKPRLKIEEFIETVPQLLRDIGAYGALLVEINLTDNISIVRAGFDRDGSGWVPLAGPHAAITEQIDQTLLVKFLRNEPVCADISVNSKNFEVAAAARKYGLTYACIVQVPPIIGVMVGGLFVAWTERPDTVTEEQAKIRMTQAALKYAIW